MLECIEETVLYRTVPRHRVNGIPSRTTPNSSMTNLSWFLCKPRLIIHFIFTSVDMMAPQILRSVS